MTDAPVPRYSSGTNSLRQLAERLDQSAVKYANDYGYCIASDLKQAAEIVRGVAQGSPDRGEFDPADIWDAYCDEVPEQFRSCQGAMAFALDYASPPAALPAGELNLPTLDEYRNNLIEECAKLITELTLKHGRATGTDYEQGVQDHGYRILHQVRALALPSTDREGGK